MEWHQGFRLEAEVLCRHPDYRDSKIVELGCRIAVDDRLDPRILGEAVNTGLYDPQRLKRVWHCVARFGCRGGERR